MGLRRACLLATLAFAGAWTAAGAGATSGVTLTVSPGDVLIDQPVSITVSGLGADSTVTLTATTTDKHGRRWQSAAVFRADDAGRVVVAQSPSLGGTYRGHDAMGLFWSMSEVGTTIPADQQVLILPIVSEVVLRAHRSNRIVASVSLIRRWAVAGLRLHRTTSAREGFVGCFWSPRHPSKPLPAILFFGGSDGGLPCGSGLLASHGYPELDLAYFGAPGLPAELERIPLEYFERALRWLARQPGVDPHRLVTWGVSRGAEAAFLLGTTYPRLVHAVVEYVGSNLVLGSPHAASIAPWTLHGKPIPIGTEIPIEKVDGPLFMVGGWSDAVGISAAAVENMAAELRTHHRHDFTALTYENAGHAIGIGIPNLPIGNVYLHYGVPTTLGGTRAGDAHAREDSWPKLLAFLGRL